MLVFRCEFSVTRLFFLKNYVTNFFLLNKNKKHDFVTMYVVSSKHLIFVLSIVPKIPPQYFNFFIAYIEKTLMLYGFYTYQFPCNFLLVASF